MAQPAASRHRYTYAEYLAYEQDSAMKHDFEDGEIRAMAGGSRRHNALASRVSAALEAKRDPGCVAYRSDQKVRVLATGKATYPDACVTCGPIEGDPADPSGSAITNPVLLVEVLSPSTEAEDRGSKWLHYQLFRFLTALALVGFLLIASLLQRKRRGGWHSGSSFYDGPSSFGGGGDSGGGSGYSGDGGSSGGGGSSDSW